MPHSDEAIIPWQKPAAWHPKLERLYAYWQSIHPPQGLPGRQHVEPTAIPDLLPDLYMVDVTGPPWRFRYRLVGTEFANRMGHDLTGRFLDEAHPGFRELAPRYVATVERRQPDYRNGPVLFAAAQKDFQRIERLMLPLARDGSHVDMILGVIVYLRNGK